MLVKDDLYIPRSVSYSVMVDVAGQIGLATIRHLNPKRVDPICPAIDKVLQQASPIC